MFHGVPIIGIAGGIGSGKSHIARLFGEMGCVVIDSDAQVAEVYRDPMVLHVLRGWWGPEVIGVDGRINRKAIASRVFADRDQRKRLEQLLHPQVNRRREVAMATAIAQNLQPKAFVWDTPLLFETGLYKQCDALVFVDTPLELRQKRVLERGWSPEELAKRENLQWPLDKKRALCNDVIVNSDPGERGANDSRGQVGQVLSRILARLSNRPA
jgi:dephospho-CoA kinase